MTKTDAPVIRAAIAGSVAVAKFIAVTQSAEYRRVATVGPARATAVHTSPAIVTGYVDVIVDGRGEMKRRLSDESQEEDERQDETCSEVSAVATDCHDKCVACWLASDWSARVGGSALFTGKISEKTTTKRLHLPVATSNR